MTLRFFVRFKCVAPAAAVALLFAVSGCVSPYRPQVSASGVPSPSPAISPSHASPSPESLTAWSQAVYSFEGGNYDDAARFAREAIVGGMDGLETRRLHAEALAYAGRIDGAEAALLHLIRHYPPKPSNYFLLGKVYLVKGDNDKAEEALSKAFSIGGSDDEALYQLGNLRMKQGSTPRAIEFFKKYVDRNPSDPEGLTRYAVALLDVGQTAEAETVLRRLLEIDPQSRLALFTIAILEEQRGKAQTAADHYDKFLEVDPDNAEVLAQRAALAETMHDTQSAVRFRTRLAVVSPKGLQNRHRLGQLLVDSDRDDEAREIFAALAGDFPELGQPHVQLGYIDLKRGRHAGAVDHFVEAAKRMKNSPEIHALIGFTHMAVKDDTRAIPAIRESYRLDSKNTQLLFTLGELYHRIGMFDHAERTFQLLLTREPMNAEALNYLGYMYAEKGIRLSKAESMLKKAVRQEPANAYYLDSLGWLYFKKGKLKLALEYLDRAAQIVSDAVIFEHLGDVHAALGSLDAARDSYRRSLEKNNSSMVEDKLLRLNSSPGP